MSEMASGPSSSSATGSAQVSPTPRIKHYEARYNRHFIVEMKYGPMNMTLTIDRIYESDTIENQKKNKTLEINNQVYVCTGKYAGQWMIVKKIKLNGAIFIDEHEKKHFFRNEEQVIIY